jgi:tetratricopeptide (TPR) repeat protein
LGSLLSQFAESGTVSWLARGHVEEQNWQKVVDMHQDWLKEVKRTRNETKDATAKTLQHIGQAYQGLGLHEEAIDVLTEGLQYMRKLQAQGVQIKEYDLNNCGGRLPPEVAEACKPETIELEFYKPIGVSLIQLGRYNESIQIQKQAMDCCRRMFIKGGQPPDAVTELVISFSMNPDVNFHGDALLAMGRTDEAIANFEACAQKCDEMVAKTLMLSEMMGMPRPGREASLFPKRFEARRNLGRALQAACRFAEAAKELETSLALFTQWTSFVGDNPLQNDPPMSDHALTLVCLAEAYLGLRQDGNALRPLKQARTILHKLGDTRAIGKMLLVLGSTHFLSARKAGESKEADAALERAAEALSEAVRLAEQNEHNSMEHIRKEGLLALSNVTYAQGSLSAMTLLQRYLDLTLSTGRQTCADCGQVRGDDVEMLTCGDCRVVRYCR